MRILVNALSGAAGLDLEVGGKPVNTNVAYGAFATAIHPVVGLQHVRVAVHATSAQC